jgi:hypothetical protein
MTTAIAERLNEACPALKEAQLGSLMMALVNDFLGVPKVYVDGSSGVGSDSYEGTEDKPKGSIQGGINVCPQNGVVLVRPKVMGPGASDPVSYAENVIIPPYKSGIGLIGLGKGRTQAGLPQIAAGTGSDPQLTIQAPGCLVAGIGINGAGATGGGILLDSDGSTKDAMGASIMGCHLKNCKVSATDGTLGGAIMWSAQGGAWQIRIAGNRFYKNIADVVLLGTGGSVPQDVVIEENVFSDPAANTDIILALAGGSGILGVEILNNIFPAFPALSAGVTKLFFDLTGCTGILSGNKFGSSGKTFKVDGTGGLIPATVFMTANYQEAAAGSSGEIGRTA